MGSACKQAHESYYTANVFRDTKQGVWVCGINCQGMDTLDWTGLCALEENIIGLWRVEVVQLPK